MRVAAILGLLAALAGCTDPHYAVSGTLTEDRTDADLEELGQLADQYGGELVLRESFPEQFTISDMDRSDCHDLHEALSQKAYIDVVGACTAEDEGAAPY